MAGFLFGAGTGDTATSLKRKRELIEELQNQIMGTTPKTTAEGIAALMKGAATGIGKYRADKVEGEKTGAASSIYNKIMGDYSSKFPAPEAAGQVSATSPVNSSQPAPVNISGDKAGFVSSLLPAAQEAAARTGVDPRIIVAQAALESGWGKSAPGNNLFGIKSHGQSGGNSLMTSEVVDGKTVRQRDNFRAYGSPAESVNGYADFITENPRYKGMRSAKGLDAQIDELGRSGYATDPEYASKIRSIAQGIELPAEVASLDPSVGMPAMTASQAIEQQAPAGGSLNDEVAQFQQSPEYAAQFPGQQPQQAMPQQAMPQPVQQQPMQQPAQQQAQPMPQAVQPNGIDPRILQALSDPFLPEEQRSALQILARQQMEQQQGQQEQQVWQQRQAYEQQARQSDPAYQLNVQKTQAEIDQMSRPGYTALTADERRQLGIPDTDQRVYQKSRDGKIDVVGGAGQTINVGNEMEARKAAAEQVGLSPDDPAYQGFILTGKLPRENEQQLTATDKKAILESDEMVQSAAAAIPLLERASQLSKEAYEGPTAGIRGTITGAFGNDAGQATTEFDNIIATQALGQLKAIFGGAPTEGERAILLEISGASSQPQKVRDNILQRAKQAVQRRMEFYQQRADEMRGGSYYKPGQEKKQDAAPQQQQRRRYNPQTGNLE